MRSVNRVATRYLLARGPSLPFQGLLAELRALHMAHWTSHWQVAGDPQYGDHLLFQRFYEAMPTEIDDLAEKIVATFGPEAVDAPIQAIRVQQEIKFAYEEEEDIFRRAFLMEQALQATIRSVFKAAEESDDLSLGMNDYLAALANAHETNIYLLQQRMGGKTAGAKPVVVELTSLQHYDPNKYAKLIPRGGKALQDQVFFDLNSDPIANRLRGHFEWLKIAGIFGSFPEAVTNGNRNADAYNKSHQGAGNRVVAVVHITDTAWAVVLVG